MLMVIAKKVGRPPLPGPRTASGRRAPAGDPRAGTIWQRIKQDGLRVGLDPRIATELSRLSLSGEITDSQVMAGFRVAEIYGRFERLKRHRRAAASPSYMRAFGDPDSEEPEIEYPSKTNPAPAAAIENDPKRQDPVARKMRAIRRAENQWRRLQDTIADLPAPQAARDLLERACVNDQRVLGLELNDLRFCLNAVAESFPDLKGQHQTPSVAVTSRQPRRHTPQQHQRPRRSDIDKTAWLACQKILRPDLSEAELEKAFATFQALKDREVFRRRKVRR